MLPTSLYLIKRSCMKKWIAFAVIFAITISIYGSESPATTNQSIDLEENATITPQQPPVVVDDLNWLEDDPEETTKPKPQQDRACCPIICGCTMCYALIGSLLTMVYFFYHHCIEIKKCTPF